MTATEELRKLLDERGVEHYDGTEQTLWGYEQTGEDTGIYRFAASEISGGFLQFYMFRITPEQAIAATLGRGTCEFNIEDNMNETEGMGDVWIECSACHCVFDYYADKWLMNMHYCPNCGREVVIE